MFPTKWTCSPAIPSVREVLDRLLLVDEQQARDVIGEHAVVLLGHRAVAAAQARLEVRDRDLELHRRERSRERRVHVAGDDDERRLALQQHLLDADERPGGLLGVRAGADAEEDVRRRQPELLEEDRRHVGVVVLPGVHEHELEAGIERLQRAVDGRRLHEVRAGADHEANRGGHASMLATEAVGRGSRQG